MFFLVLLNTEIGLISFGNNSWGLGKQKFMTCLVRNNCADLCKVLEWINYSLDFCCNSLLYEAEEF